MNSHITLLSPSAAFATAPATPYFRRRPANLTKYAIKAMAHCLDFKTVTHEDMPAIWKILRTEIGRTTDFSYGGLLMWVDYFRYEFSIVNDTLFIKGRVESDISQTAFSLPVGKMPVESSVAVLAEYCRINNLPLIFSAVPEYAIPEFEKLHPVKTELLADWSDYLYDATALATLSGKKYGKKRNHVNQFITTYPGYSYEHLGASNINDALRFMDRIDAEGDDTPMAVTERTLNRYMLKLMRKGDPCLKGGMLRDAEGNVLAFTIGDIKGDTLFIHIEKSLREVAGGFEMINKTFAAEMLKEHPELRYINREDDSGDPGLRHAKQSYHPAELLRKYNVRMLNGEC